MSQNPLKMFRDARDTQVIDTIIYSFLASVSVPFSLHSTCLFELEFLAWPVVVPQVHMAGSFHNHFLYLNQWIHSYAHPTTPVTLTRLLRVTVTQTICTSVNVENTLHLVSWLSYTGTMLTYILSFQEYNPYSQME